MAKSHGGLIVSHSERNSLLSTANACFLSFIFPGKEICTSRQHIYAAGKFAKGIFIPSSLALTQCNWTNLTSSKIGSDGCPIYTEQRHYNNDGVMTFSFRIYDRKSHDLTGNSKGVLLLCTHTLNWKKENDSIMILVSSWNSFYRKK